MEPSEQLEAIRGLDEILTRRFLDYWIFGGWAVDLHVGRVTRTHDDLVIAVWEADPDEFADAVETAGRVCGEPGWHARVRRVRTWRDAAETVVRGLVSG